MPKAMQEGLTVKSSRLDPPAHSDQQAAVIIDATRVRRMIAEQFPQWADLDVQGVEPDGWDNRTFRLGETMSIRLPSAVRYVAQVEKEHCWLPSMAPHLPLPIPVPIAKGAPSETYPWPWSIYRWLAGESVASARIAKLKELAQSLARFILALERIDPTDGPVAGEHNFHRGGQLAHYDAETRAALAVLGQRLDMATAEKLWDEAVQSRWRKPPVWVHGDIAAGNLLVKHDALCAVIDFGGLAVGDPACDLVAAWTMFSGESRESFRAALPFDDATWTRARGWALWKALIIVAGDKSNGQQAGPAWAVIDDVLLEHGETRRA